MLALSTARDALRIDGTDNDALIQSMLDAIPDYIETTTGMAKASQDAEPLVNTAARFIIQLWYNAEQADSEKLQRTIDGLLKVITVKARV